MTKPPFARALSLILIACLGLLTACSAQPEVKNPDAMQIVASTTIWGDIARTLVGDNSDFEITVIADNSEQDPHDFEPTAKDIATIKNADIRLGNGGGYDPWFTDVEVDTTALITAMSATEPTNNPHIWFNTDAVRTFTNNLISEINHIKPGTELQRRAVLDQLDSFDQQRHDFKHLHLLATEAIAGYLLDRTPVHDLTPEAYVKAIVSETEPSAEAVAEALKLFDEKHVDFVIATSDKPTGAAGKIVDTAHENNIPVVVIPETPDNDQDYFEYFEKTIQDINAVPVITEDGF